MLVLLLVLLVLLVILLVSFWWRCSCSHCNRVVHLLLALGGTPLIFGAGGSSTSHTSPGKSQQTGHVANWICPRCSLTRIVSQIDCRHDPYVATCAWPRLHIPLIIDGGKGTNRGTVVFSNVHGDGELEIFAGEKPLDVQGIFYLVHYHMPGKLVINHPPRKINMSPEKETIWKENIFFQPSTWRDMLVFRGVSL